jgi:hypothetical protein
MIDHYFLSYNSDFYQRFKTINNLPSFPKNIEVHPGDIEPIIIRQEGLTLAWVNFNIFGKRRQIVDGLKSLIKIRVVT